jgi:hypothetical protein
LLTTLKAEESLISEISIRGLYWLSFYESDLTTEETGAGSELFHTMDKLAEISQHEAGFDLNESTLSFFASSEALPCSFDDQDVDKLTYGLAFYGEMVSKVKPTFCSVATYF